MSGGDVEPEKQGRPYQTHASLSLQDVLDVHVLLLICTTAKPAL